MPIQDLQKKLPLIIAIAAGVLALALLKVYLQQRENELVRKVQQAQAQAQPVAPPAKEIIPVLIAQKDIPAQTPITQEDLAIKEVPVDYIQPGAVTSLDQVIGQITSGPIAAGEQILLGKLLPPGKSGKSLSEITPEGKRALTITVDNIADVLSLFRPGDYVDVLALITPPPDSSQKAPSPKLVTVSQYVEVLAVGAKIASLPGVSPASKGGEPSAPLGTVTLALSPQEAVLISFIQEHGKIKLILRSPEDNKSEPIQPAGWDTLLEYLYPSTAVSKEISSEEKGPEPTVEIYRGSSKEVVPLGGTAKQ